MEWVAFFLSLISILVISKKNLAIALIAGALLLGVMTAPPNLVYERVSFVLTDTSVLILAVAMAIIPLVGGIMTENGLIDSMVNNLRISRRYLMASSASLMGLLPMPGGALLSAPIVEKGGEGIDSDLKAAINNWFRHLFILIYPLSPALVASARMTGLDVYYAIVCLLPGAALASVLGYMFYLRHVSGRIAYAAGFSLRGLLIPLSVILSAPILDFVLKRAFSAGSVATLTGVTTALVLSLVLGTRVYALRPIVKRMKPWNFGLIIIGMFLYLHMFQESGIGRVIAGLPLPPVVLSVLAGFVLGIATGRVLLPASIVYPVYLASVDHVSSLVFALIYISIYFGYVISPVHPCLVVTCEFFKITIREQMSRLAAPTAILFGAVLVVATLLVL